MGDRIRRERYGKLLVVARADKLLDAEVWRTNVTLEHHRGYDVKTSRCFVDCDFPSEEAALTAGITRGRKLANENFFLW